MSYISPTKRHSVMMTMLPLPESVLEYFHQPRKSLDRYRQYGYVLYFCAFIYSRQVI